MIMLHVSISTFNVTNNYLWFLTDVIQRLIMNGKHIIALKFIFEFGLADQFPPVPLLKAHLTDTKKVAQNIRKSGKNSRQALVKFNICSHSSNIIILSLIFFCWYYYLLIPCLPSKLAQYCSPTLYFGSNCQVLMTWHRIYPVHVNEVDMHNLRQKWLKYCQRLNIS